MAPDLGLGLGLGGASSFFTSADASRVPSNSNIRVFVRWYEPAVFSGDDVRCRITFSNVAEPVQEQEQQQQQQQQQPPSATPPPSASALQQHQQLASSDAHRRISNGYSVDRARFPPSSQQPAASSSLSASPSTLAPPPLPRSSTGRGRHQRGSQSLSGPPPAGGGATAASTVAGAAARRRADPTHASAGSGGGGGSSGSGRTHHRSLSIVSISSAGTAASSPDKSASGFSGAPQPMGTATAAMGGRPVRGHSRASSLQIGPRGTAVLNGPRSATNPPRPFSSQPSPLFNSFASTDRGQANQIAGMRGSGRLTSSASVPNTATIARRPSPRAPPEAYPEFTFPAAAAAAPPTPTITRSGLVSSPIDEGANAVSPPSPDFGGDLDEKPLPALPNATMGPPAVPAIYKDPSNPSSTSPPAEARILATTSIAGTPRSSGEFYSISNHSTETLASEYIGQAARSGRPQHGHRKSSSSLLLSPQPHPYQQSQQLHPHQANQSLSQRARTAAAAAAAATTTAGGPGTRAALLPPPSAASAAAATASMGASSAAAAAAAAPETLMMGYAQIQGSFTLDGSLVNLAPFEQVKRKGVVGGQGGGVVGLETSGGNKRESSLFRALTFGFGGGSTAAAGNGRGGVNGNGQGTGNGIGGNSQTGGPLSAGGGGGGIGGWSSLASSLGEFLTGGGELSTIREMRDRASAKAVPLLSTPQSVLFVDLRLAPGESKTFEYSFRLPRGLPPSHRGKVMKISYGLVVGTQRPGTTPKEQRMRSIEVPFRVLGSVNNHGEVLGHDLMTPYILLRDQAVVRPVSEKERHRPWTLADPKEQQKPLQMTRRRSSTAATITAASSGGNAAAASAGLRDFKLYVDELLKQNARGSERDPDADVDDEADDNDGGTASRHHRRRRSGLLSPTANLSAANLAVPGAASSRRASTASSVFWPGEAADANNSSSGRKKRGSSASIAARPMLALTSREAIDLAILRSNRAGALSDGGGDAGGGPGASPRRGPVVSANRFEIARDGRKVGTVLLARPAYRLGETVTMVVDFQGAAMRCYAVHAALETNERVVDPSLALRSEASIQRVTRRVYASLSEVTLYGRRFVFAATIPTTATPEFMTSGVSLEWRIRIEFVVPGEDDGDDAHLDDDEDDGDDADGGEDDDEADDDDGDSDGSGRPAQNHTGGTRGGRRHRHRRPSRAPPPLLEEVSSDDRGGLVLVAAETLACESFEAAVPLRVYGWGAEGGGDSSAVDDRDGGWVV